MSSKLRAKMLKACKNPAAGFFDDEDYGKIRDYIDTGSVVLNSVISAKPRGGIPSGKIVQMAGPSSSGKSFVCFETIKNAQKSGYFIIYYDSEAATDQASIIERGVDPANLLYVPVASVEELTTSILNILGDLSKDDQVMIIIDSLGNLSSTKELEDSTDGKGTRDMTRAQKLKALFRTTTVKAGILNVPIIAVNHVYACGTEKMQVLMGDLSEKSLKDIQKGDFVRTTFGTEEVLYKVKYEDVVVYEIKLENGETLEFTSEHKFLVEKDGEFVWTAVCDLSKNDLIISKIVDFQKNKIVNIKKKENKETVYDIETGSHNYILNNGVISHNTIGSFFGGNTVSGGCLTEKMNIKTSLGICSIKDIQLGDLVDTMYGPKKVLTKFNYSKEVNKIKLSNGNIIEATDEHRFLVENSDGYIWKCVSELKSGDELIIL